MPNRETVEGVGILVIAVSMLAAFALRMMVPNADIVRAAGAPALVAVHPAIEIHAVR